MARLGAVFVMSIVAGGACVYLLPPLWLGRVATAVAIRAGGLALAIRVTTRTSPPADPMAGVLLSLVNLPEQPLAKVKEGKLLVGFLVLAAFLVSMAITVMVLASA